MQHDGELLSLYQQMRLRENLSTIGQLQLQLQLQWQLQLQVKVV